MRLVITDTGFIWNQNNPFLEKYKDIVLVVCLLGKAVTDKYECFISPFTNNIGLGISEYGIEDRKMQALASVGRELNEKFGYHNKIVFLTDSQPSTLYPFYVIKELNQYNSLHLVAMSPWRFESRSRRKGYYEMLSDLSQLNSVLYYDNNKVLEILGTSITFSEAYSYITNDLGKIMPCFLNSIHTMRSGSYFFDFASMEYILLENGFDKNDIFQSDIIEIDRDVKISITNELSTMGVVVRPSYPKDSIQVKEEVERLPERLDGKKICNLLREQRIRLAKANHISFKSEECPFTGPCAGTCEKCDAESEYLRKQLQKIPEEKRIYPQFDPGKKGQV